MLKSIPKLAFLLHLVQSIPTKDNVEACVEKETNMLVLVLWTVVQCYIRKHSLLG